VSGPPGFGGFATRSSGRKFDPLDLGVTGAWFRTADAVNSGPGLAFTLPNLLSPHHATTTTDARKPTLGTSANGLPILTCATSCLLVPLHAAINNATTWWISFHARITTAAGNPVPFAIDTGGALASTRKVLIQRFSGDCINVHDAASPTTLARRFGPATLWPLNTWVHCIYELNLATGGAEASRGVACANGVAVSSTFANAVGAPNNLPAAMATPTGSMAFFSYRPTDALNPFVGQIGPNILIGNAAMAEATTGCLTPEARLALSNFERPTS
jgi:hypothetical protein